MSLGDILRLAGSGIPGLDAGLTVAQATYSSIENVKLYRQQCKDMNSRCVDLIVSLRDSSAGLEGQTALALLDEVTVVLERINRKVTEWAALSRIRSFLQQREIKDGIDKLYRDTDAAVMKVNIQLNLELTRGHIETRQIQERDKAEVRDLLEKIIQSTDDMKALLNMQPSAESEPVAEVMQSLQTELRDSDLAPVQEESFRRGLWMLHERTARLPPLEDLTGQVTMSTDRLSTVAKGTFNDIYLGQWLDREPVALRLPRALANSPDAQKRFQREVRIWRSLVHDNIVPLYGIVYIGEDVYSVSPWQDNGTAIMYVQKNASVDRLKVLSEVAEGLEYLHQHGVVHGDLRGANVLIDRTGTARLSDFGLSKFLEDCGKGMTSSPGINPRWTAPELLLVTGRLSTHSDVWSFGMTVLELLTGEQPYKDFSRDISVLRELDQGKIPSRPDRKATERGLSDDLWALMKECWSKRPEKRPSVTTIKVKLAAMRGLTQSSPVAKRRSTSSFFSKKRPSTGDSTSSNKSSHSPNILRLGMPFMSPTTPKKVVDEETDDALLSPISIHVSNGSSLHSPSSFSAGHHSAGSLSTTFSISASPESIGLTKDLPFLDVPGLPGSLPKQSAYAESFRSSSTFEQHSPPARSTNSSGSTNSISLSTRPGPVDPRIVLRLSSAGSVASGTLEGLVDRLIRSTTLRRDLEFRDILLSTCVDFSTPGDVFEIMCARFYQAEDDANVANRIEVQSNIFTVVKEWVSGLHFRVDPNLLGQMKEFCLSALSVKRASVMNEKAKDIIRTIDTRIQEGVSPIPISPGRRIPKTSEITPHDLAIAMTLMEGDQYKSILPSDYLIHLGRQSVSTPVGDASLLNNKIVLWVKKSILHYDRVEHRVEVLKFFANTAEECRRFRNFSSLSAIVSTLQSKPIQRLSRTREALPPQMKALISELCKILDPGANHLAYRNALKQTAVDAEYNDGCIPWIAVHLRELNSLLLKHPSTVNDDGRSLINFDRYVKFMDRLNDVLDFSPPDLERYRKGGQLAYLDHQLRNIRVDAQVEESLEERSKALEAEETRDYRKRTRELQSLGFKTPS